MSELIHYGILRRSGRYPWGSGENPYQRSKSFNSYVSQLRSEGLSDADIAKGLGMTTTQFRQTVTLASAEKRAGDAAEAVRLKDKGYSNVAIAERLGVSEGSVRNLLKESTTVKENLTKSASNALKESVDANGYIDIGPGVERYMGISRTRLDTAVDLLREDGYKIYYVQVEQLGTGNFTNVKVLGKPDGSYADIRQDLSKIKPIDAYSQDGGVTYHKIEAPKSVKGSRIQIRYGDEDLLGDGVTGSDMDGVIQLRRGVDDISLGQANYAQVRIAVDGKYYLKGMAMYTDDLPDGVDIRFNTNKKKGTPIEKVYKEMKSDPSNPFGATIKGEEELKLAQRYYTDKNRKRQQSCINIVNEEGNWGEWSKTLASQMLSKQKPQLAERQLKIAFDAKQTEYEEIIKLTNPVIRKKLLDSFADDCDAAASHLKAAALPRQQSQVILPFPSMKDNEIYAPNFRDGETVVLIRYPHGGKFEIPELTVNNRAPEPKKAIGRAKDAVGINKKVADQLSGADFDGDTVLVIPNNSGDIKTSSPLKGLKDFDPKVSYPAYEGMPKMKSRTKQQEMGKVSNLITDMTIKGASMDEIARAVRHSMVVIDAEKHNLNYKQSAIDNGIAELKAKYQGGPNAGASTLISRAGSTVNIPTRKEGTLVTDPATGKTRRVYVDPATGKKLYTTTNETYTVSTTSKKTGEIKTKTVARTQEVSRMSLVDDAFILSSGTQIEAVYATHANRLKGLANQARKDSLNIQPTPYSPSAKKTYATEVASLNAKLNTALKNAPLERQAQILANVKVSAAKKANPEMDRDELKKRKSQALKESRAQVGAKKTQVDVTDKEWEAIQAGAISSTMLSSILNNADMDRIKSLATPRAANALSPSQVSRIKTMLNSGYTQAEIQDALGVSITKINEVAKG